MQAAQVGGVIGVEQQGTIAGIEQGQGQVGRALLGPNQQQHLPLRIHGRAETPLGPGGGRLAEGQRGAVQAVGGGLRQGEGIADRLNRHRWRLQVSGAE